MKIKIAVSVVFLMLTIQIFSIAPVAKIIAQTNAPLIITSYSANYQEGSRSTSEGIRHVVEYKNASEKKVVAVQIGLVSFDVWNEFLGRTGGISLSVIDPGKSEKGAWLTNAFSDFSFLTGFAYVSKVRFDDGTIWVADLNEIAEEMRKIERDFDIQILKAKTEKK